MVARKASNENEEDLAGEIEETDDELEDVEEDDEEEVAAGLAISDDDEEDEEASLEDLLAQRGAARRAAGEPDEDEDDDIMALSSEPELAPNAEIRTKVIPIKDRQEFVCKRCHLVKARSQLADEDRLLCRDCV